MTDLHKQKHGRKEESMDRSKDVNSYLHCRTEGRECELEIYRFFVVVFLHTHLQTSSETVIYCALPPMHHRVIAFVRSSHYRVVKRNCQVVRFVDFGQMNHFIVQNSSPTCQHNLFTLIQIKKMFF